jgi:hypothetical protein
MARVLRTKAFEFKHHLVHLNKICHVKILRIKLLSGIDIANW